MYHGCTVTTSSLLDVTAGSSMPQQQQQQQQDFTLAQPAMPMQAPTSHPPKATPSAQAGQGPFPLHHHPASRLAAQSPSTGASAAAPAAEQAPTASQTRNPSPSGMTEQPQGPRAGGLGMNTLHGRPANPYGRGGVQQLSPYGDNAQQRVYSSNPNPGMGSFASGGANPVHMMNGSQPEHAGGMNGPEAHESSNGMQAVAHPQQPQSTQSSSGATAAPADPAAGGVSQQEAPRGVAAEMLNKARPHETCAAADGVDKAANASRDAMGNVVHQSELAKGDVSETGDLEDELIEPQTLAGGQSISHNLLAD